ncbi:MAG TPA: metallophosphoesterase [Chthoniobacterales bacterium]|nr:metallophosphoesterase [Chthoniobacterales bacterium]
MSNLTRRKFLGLGALALPAVLGADSAAFETTALRVTELRHGKGNCRFVHFTDFHYKGDSEYAAEVVRTINQLRPDFVCFTGDLVEEARFAPEAFSFIRQIESPVYGTPGNHDFQSGVSHSDFASAFAATRGAWLKDDCALLAEHELELVGFGRRGVHAFTSPRASRQVLLLHYPQVANGLGRQFDLILAGHSHGGQVRLPILGALVLPKGVGHYEHGYYETPCGPMYVNAGIGTYRIPFRWNCPPELTLITI